MLFWSGRFGDKDYTQLVAYSSNKPNVVYVVPYFVNYICSFFLAKFRKNNHTIFCYLYIKAFARSVKPIDIILKHEKAPHIGSWAFNTLASDSRIICKNEAVRAEAETSIHNCDALAVLASDINALVPSTGLQLTSASELTLDPGETAYVSWQQLPVDTTENVT